MFNHRPVYTQFELSYLIKKKFFINNFYDADKIAIKYNIPKNILQEIYQGKISFGPIHYKTCCKLLNLNIKDIIKEYDDTNFKNNQKIFKDEKMTSTVLMANMLFNEIIMQSKISIH